MFCKECGAEIPEGQYTCFVCGAYTGSVQVSENSQINVNYTSQYQVNNTYQNLMNQAVDTSYSVQPEIGMKWYKFVVNFMLFFSAVLNLFGGIATIKGGHYVDEQGVNRAEAVYAVYSGLKTIDIVMGVFCICLAAYALFVRQMLVNKKRIAPILFIAIYVVDIVAVIFYSMAVVNVAHLSISDILDIKDIAINLVWVVINAIYFAKRKHIFVN